MADRRAFLGGLAAASFAAFPLASQPVRAAINVEASEQASALRQVYRLADGRMRRALDRHYDLEETVVLPEPPEALFAQDGNFCLLKMQQQETHWPSGRRWYGREKIIEAMRGETYRYLSGHPIVEAVRRRDEIVGAWDEWNAALQRVSDTSGMSAAKAEMDAANDALKAIRLQLIEMRTTDPNLMVLKAEVFFDLLGGEMTEVDKTLRWECEKHGPFEEALAFSLVRDFIGLLPTALQVPA